MDWTSLQNVVCLGKIDRFGWEYACKICKCSTLAKKGAYFCMEAQKHVLRKYWSSCPAWPASNMEFDLVSFMFRLSWRCCRLIAMWHPRGLHRQTLQFIYRCFIRWSAVQRPWWLFAAKIGFLSWMRSLGRGPLYLKYNLGPLERNC